MNSNSISTNESTLIACQIELFLGRRLGPIINTEAYAMFLLIAVVNIITCPFTTVLNGLLIVAVKMKPRLQNNSNLALACLATTDWIMGVLGQPIFIACIIIILQGRASKVNCSVIISTRSLLRMLGVASILHLALINVERYIAIKHAFKYISLVTKARILQSCAFLWMTTLVVTIPVAMIDILIYNTVSSLLMILSMAVTIFCQLVLYFETRRHEKRIAVQQVSVESRRKFLEEKKALKVTTTVLFTLLLTYSPIILARVLGGTAVINTVNVMQIVLFSAISMTILNSVINPIIYCLRIRQFRVAFIEIVFRKNNVQGEGN